MIDTGIGTPEALAALEAGLAAHGLSIEAIGQVVLTHKHADHIGLAREIHDRSGAPVFVHEDDWDGVANLDARHEEFIPLVCQRLRDFHTPEADIEELAQVSRPRQAIRPRRRRPRNCATARRLSVSGQDLEVIHTPGHTQGSIWLRYGHYLFSGDHVLPTISPNIGAGELRRSGMMRRFLDSLDRVAKLTGRRSGRAARPRHAVFESGRARAASCKRTTSSARRRFSRSCAPASPRRSTKSPARCGPSCPAIT